ncbi:MAG TPA: DivIVA domain-containing protein [Propionibacteriaceae bacterium]|nr:DivIVA domain-containing protein [Propionibacteriaceae bacterium]
MTLTLDEVRNIKFPMAKRVGEGYRCQEVDDFLDRVDAGLVEVLDENARLQAQIEALGDGQDSGLGQENDNLKAELEALRAAPVPVVDEAELNRLRDENAGLRGELDSVRGELDGVRNEVEGYRNQPAGEGVDEAELQRLRDENAGLRGELEELRNAPAPQVDESELARLRDENAGLRQELASAPQALADGAVAQHLVVTSSADASSAVTRLVQLATEQAEDVVAEAERQAAAKLEAAERQTQEMLLDARTRGDRVESEARVNAEKLTADTNALVERLTSEAQANHDRVNSDAEARRAELFTTLESERDEFHGKVDRLRSFEADFRGRLTGYLRKQVEKVENDVWEPEDKPSLLEERGASSTPRLDALLQSAQGSEEHTSDNWG